MPHRKPARPLGNALLGPLPDPRFQAFVATLQPIELDTGAVVAHANAPCSGVVFPITGVLSVMAVVDGSVPVGAGLVGNEGFAPLAPFHGAAVTPEQIEVHVPGLFVQISAPLLQQAVTAFPELRQRLHLFGQFMFSSVARTSACDRRHDVLERCARLILSTHDRAANDEFAMTHDRLAAALGVRRASISVTADELRRSGAIAYRRGVMRVTDRLGLLDACCGCYKELRALSEQLLGAA